MYRPCHRFVLSAFVAASIWPAAARAQTPARWLEGMWSNPPATIVGLFCAFSCTQAGIDALNALIDDPANDAVPYPQLGLKAQQRQDDYVRSVLTPAAAKTFPLDPADDPSFLRCEPYGLARQMFAPHQLEIRSVDRERLDFHYGEWDAHRTIYLNPRTTPGAARSRFGHSVGRWDGDEFVIETTGAPAGLAGAPAGSFQHSEQLRIVERYSRTKDGKAMWLTATLTDPVTLREPLVLKHMWGWSPGSKIAAYENCEIPTEVKRGTRR